MTGEGTLGPLEQLIELLRARDFSDEEFLRDAFWLAQFVPAGSEREPPRPIVKPGEPRPDRKVEQQPSTGQKETKKSLPDSSPPPAPAALPDAPPDGQLYPRVNTAKDAARKATSIFVPASGALPQPLELARALRPFQQKFRSRRRLRLDVEATVELSADRQELTPVLAREKERWFSLSLLIDDAPAMAVWRKTSRELVRFLGSLGIFRDVRAWTVDQNLRFTSAAGRASSPKQLVDTAGRTLIVVLTHGVGPHWQSRELAQWLTGWARTGPVAICSLLPPLRWEGTDLGPAYLWARSPSPGAGNSLLAAGEGRRAYVPKSGVAVLPVFPLTKRGLRDWAAMQMSRRETRLDAVPVSPDWFEPRASVVAQPVSDVSQRVAEFRGFASEDAGRLLELLSAIPLSLPIMRLAQYTMMPESPLSALAEVLMSGLIVPHPGSPGGPEPESMLFDFAPDAREYLRDRTSVRDLEKIHREVSGAVRDYIERRAGLTDVDFEAWLADEAGIRNLPPDIRYFAQVTAETLRALGYSGHPKAPPETEERPGLYVTWDAPEHRPFALEIALGLRDRGLRILLQGEEYPAKGSVVFVVNTKNYEDDHIPLTLETRRIIESGFEIIPLVPPGIAPDTDSQIFADRYASREELLDALIDWAAKRDRDAAPRPKGAPPLDVERGLLAGEDATRVEELLKQKLAVVYQNEVFKPSEYIRDLVWIRDARLHFKGGIHWLHGDEAPEEKPGQLLVFERPSSPALIPEGCCATLIDPEFRAIADFPDSIATYEGSAAALKDHLDSRADRLRTVLPDAVVNDLRHSMHLLELAEAMTGDAKVWPLVRDRFGDVWEMWPRPNTVTALDTKLRVLSFEALEPELRDAAGIAAALRDEDRLELSRKLIPAGVREKINDLGLTDGSDAAPHWLCRKLASMNLGWTGWHERILEALDISSGDWLAKASADPYTRRNLIYHLIHSRYLSLLQEVASHFGWWELRITKDGPTALLEEMQRLPVDEGPLSQIRAFAESLAGEWDLTVEQCAVNISQSDLPLPQALKESARAGFTAQHQEKPSRWVLLAGSRRSSPEKQIESETILATEAVVREIARSGLGLVCGTEFGADVLALRTFIQERRAMELSPGLALKVVIHNQSALPFPLPSGTTVVRAEDTGAGLAASADAIILFGGRQFVRRLAEMALSVNKKLFPIPGTGGAAEKLFQEMNLAPGLPWAAQITSAEDAARIARALMREINAGELDHSLRDERLKELCACRSRTLPEFLVRALGTSLLDAVFQRDGFFRKEKSGEIVMDPGIHAEWHGKADSGIHRRISQAIEANVGTELSLRERLFHLIRAGEREKALAAAKDVSWLLAAADLFDPGLFEDLTFLGLTDLTIPLRSQGRTARARLAASPDLAIARAALRYRAAPAYIEVVGSGSRQLEAIQQASAEAIGAALANNGLGLITGAWPGVDYVTAQSYLENGGKFLVHAVTSASTDRFHGALEVDSPDADWPVRLSDAVVLIGGLGATIRVFESARRLGKPVFPYGPSGGDAETMLAMLQDDENALLHTDLNPEEFASMVVSRLQGESAGGGLERMWNLAAQYDRTRKALSSGPDRTLKMTLIFERMLEAAPDAAASLKQLQGSSSAGRRLAAIAILNRLPRREELDWLAERLDNPEIEKPFVGFQAAQALLSAVRGLDEQDCELLESVLGKAHGLAAKLPGDADRIRILELAERQLMMKRTSRPEEFDVTRLVQRELSARGYSTALVTGNVLIFRTSGQRTWISFSTAGVVCVLDNRPRNEDYFEAQWFQRLSDIRPSNISATDRSGKSGTLTIGDRARWLYSPELWDSERLRARLLDELARAQTFRDRTRAIPA